MEPVLATIILGHTKYYPVRSKTGILLSNGIGKHIIGEYRKGQNRIGEYGIGKNEIGEHGNRRTRNKRDAV